MSCTCTCTCTLSRTTSWRLSAETGKSFSLQQILSHLLGYISWLFDQNSDLCVRVMAVIRAREGRYCWANSGRVCAEIEVGFALKLGLGLH